MRGQAGLEPSRTPAGSLLCLSLKTIYFFNVETTSLLPGLNTKTDPAVPDTGPKPQAFGWRAKQAAGFATQSCSSRSLPSSTQEAGRPCPAKAEPSPCQNEPVQQVCPAPPTSQPTGNSSCGCPLLGLLTELTPPPCPTPTTNGPPPPPPGHWGEGGGSWTIKETEALDPGTVLKLFALLGLEIKNNCCSLLSHTFH